VIACSDGSDGGETGNGGLVVVLMMGFVSRVDAVEKVADFLPGEDVEGLETRREESLDGIAYDVSVWQCCFGTRCVLFVRGRLGRGDTIGGRRFPRKDRALGYGDRVEILACRGGGAGDDGGEACVV
jgi:hypothetical protein